MNADQTIESLTVMIRDFYEMADVSGTDRAKFLILTKLKKAIAVTMLASRKQPMKGKNHGENSEQ